MTGARRAALWMIHRLFWTAPVILGVTALTFLLIHLAPGDPIYLLAGDGGSAAYYADMREKYGLDRSLPEQFVRYAGAIARGDFGTSFMYQRPVAGLLLEHLFASLLLGVTALGLAAGGGFFAGVAAASTRSRVLDAVIRGGAALAYAAPVFWTGQMFVLLGAVWLGILPVSGMSSARTPLDGVAHAADVARHLILPALTLSLPLAAVTARITRAAMIEAGREPFVMATRARGIGPARVLLRHVAPHALIPVSTFVAQHAGQIVASAALTEALFGWPGIGYLVLHATLHRDYALVTTAFIGISAGVVIMNAAADALGAWLDPRMRPA